MLASTPANAWVHDYVYNLPSEYHWCELKSGDYTDLVDCFIRTEIEKGSFGSSVFHIEFPGRENKITISCSNPMNFDERVSKGTMGTYQNRKYVKSVQVTCNFNTERSGSESMFVETEDNMSIFFFHEHTYRRGWFS